MNSNIRIKELRQALNLSQEEFGKRISCSRDVINNYERQRANVPPPTELAIASAFGVNLDWLRTGTGEMFLETKEHFIDQLVQRYNGDDLLKRVIEAFISLDDKERKAILKFIDNLDPEPTESALKLMPLKPEEETESVLKLARSSDDQGAETARISKSEISAALADREKDDSTLK